MARLHLNLGWSLSVPGVSRKTILEGYHRRVSK
jgi:hypothetical protein